MVPVGSFFIISEAILTFHILTKQFLSGPVSIKPLGTGTGTVVQRARGKKNMG
jgi:hypothetical protein